MNTLKLTLIIALLLALLSALIPHGSAEAGLRPLASLPEKESILRGKATVLPAGTSFSRGYPLEGLKTAIVPTFL